MSFIIDTALNGQEAYAGKAYFFKGDQYVRYDWNSGQVDSGFPLDLGLWQLPGDFRLGVDAARGDLHYYRYQVGGPWTRWKPDQTLARWARVQRRLSIGAHTARPVWFALRQANADGLVSVSSDEALNPGTNFGVRITVHTTQNGSHRPISNSEFVIDGAIAAFHDDQLSDELVAALLPKLPSVTEHELRHALRHTAGPVFPTPAVQISKSGLVQINPADDRCWLGEYTVSKDSTSRRPELSGELFSIREA